MFIFHFINPLKLKFGFYLWQHFNSINELIYFAIGIIFLILLLLKLIFKVKNNEIILLLFCLIVIFYFNFYQPYNFVFEYNYYKEIGNKVHSCVKEYKLRNNKYPENLSDLDINCLKENQIEIERFNKKIDLIILKKEILNRSFDEEKYFEDQYQIYIRDSMFGGGKLELNEGKTDFVLNRGS